ncbi:hypothetical protein VTN77DRAFT_1703 [Rasamsonia byssochlamydoides]|uniref:uncharacterized protein n=1 Tax=Rasamsonia byssochlamydoides TaxID=89139 RepID=UPI0037441CB3
MSPPTKQLGKLSIGENMPTTRSQARRAQDAEAPRHDEDDTDDVSDDAPGNESDETEEEEEEEEEDNQPLARMVRARSKIVYDLESLEMESRARALAGLTGQFDVIYCRETPGVYEFQLAERPLVRIRAGAPECTCSEFENRPDIACRHIFWLVDQLYDSISPRTPPPGVPLSSGGFSPKLPRLDELLHDRLEAVAEHLDWQYVPGTASPSGSDPENGGMTRQDKVRDIMSAFSEILPEEFRRDLVETTDQRRTPEQCVVQGDFEATLFRLAVHDDNVYTSLRKAMPAGACAAIYFDKIQKRSRDLLAQFDVYRDTGRLPVGERPLDVKEVAQRLRQNVNRIQANLSVRIPYGSKGAAQALVMLLQEVSTRNIDAFEGNRWGRVAPPGEDEDDRNLYEQLIGQANEAEGLFVLDALEELPSSVLRQYLPHLNEILGKIEINRAPSPYVLKLKSLIHDAESGATTSRAKRPATGPAGGSQKRTK